MCGLFMWKIFAENEMKTECWSNSWASFQRETEIIDRNDRKIEFSRRSVGNRHHVLVSISYFSEWNHLFRVERATTIAFSSKENTCFTLQKEKKFRWTNDYTTCEHFIVQEDFRRNHILNAWVGASQRLKKKHFNILRVS